MSFYEVKKSFQGGSFLYLVEVPTGVRITNGWQCLLEKLGEMTDGGHGYGYRMTVVRRLRKEPKDLSLYRSKLKINSDWGLTSGRPVKKAPLKEKPDGWSREAPVEPGWYWFYGWMFGKPVMSGRKEKADLNPVQVFKVANDVSYIAMNSFLEVGVMDGKWMKMVEPELPEV